MNCGKICFVLVLSIVFFGYDSFAQNKKTSNQGAFYSGTYRNVFREAGYKQKDIDEKIAKVSWRRFFIYTPPGYDANSNEKYPVLYILHGGGEDERGWATQGKTDLILDNLIAEGKARPMLVVMPDANLGIGGFSGDAIENSLRMFEREMKQAIVPFVEKNYRALNDANSRALAGLSLGGLHTLYTGFNNTTVFSYLGVFSSGWILPMLNKTADAQYSFIKTNESSISKNLKSLWIGMGGKEDIAYNNGKIMLAKFDEMGIKYTYSEYPGGHTWPVWRNNLYNFAQVLFK